MTVMPVISPAAQMLARWKHKCPDQAATEAFSCRFRPRRSPGARMVVTASRLTCIAATTIRAASARKSSGRLDRGELGRGWLGRGLLLEPLGHEVEEQPDPGGGLRA